MQRFELWALQDIAVGEALTMDYASTEDVLFNQFRCSCGSANCRTWITGRRARRRTSTRGNHCMRGQATEHLLLS